jgi:hypothetical protein
MTLGELLVQFEDEIFAAETALCVGDLVTISALCDQAGALGLTLGAHAARAMRQYSDAATDDEWLTLVGAMNRADDPAAVYMRRAFAHAKGSTG